MSSLRNRNAFTLIELVVSLAITAVIAAFLFSFSSSLADIWRSSQSDVDTALDVNIALDQITMDLESAIFLEEGVPMLALDAIAKSGGSVDRTNAKGRWQDVESGHESSDRPASMHFDPDNHRYGWAGIWLRFFSSQPSLNAIGYQIIRKPAYSGSGIPRYLLHRAVVRHDYTLMSGFDITVGDYIKDPTSSSADAPNVRSPQVSAVLLENVVDFGVRLYIYQSVDATNYAPKGLRMIFPATTENGNVIDLTTTSFSASTRLGEDFTVRYPDVVEVYLRVLNQRGADLLYRAQEIGENASYESILEQHSKIYRRMVRIPGLTSQ